MRQVYSAEHPTEAHIVKGILETQGIDCVVRGEILFAARGELPITHETAPSVWIVEEYRYLEALDIVRRYERANQGTNRPVAKWRCFSCGEELEGQFTHCWQCGLPRDFPASYL